MITIGLSQGLGNQIFQYCLGESLKLQLNNEIEVNYLFDLRPPDQMKMWDIFDVKINWIDDERKKLRHIYKISPTYRHYLFKIFKSLKLNKRLNIFDDSNYLHKNILKNKNNIYLKGYWQNLKLFSNQFRQITNELKFKKKLNIHQKLNNIKIYNKNSILIAVHIRGGDYLQKKNSFLRNNINKEYYLNWINIFRKKFINRLFIFFSDDNDYLNKMDILNDNDCINFSEISPCRIDDFQYLSLCNHFIIPNSTFSLWAYYLNKNKNKILITPDSWYSFDKNIIRNLVTLEMINKKNNLLI